VIFFRPVKLTPTPAGGASGLPPPNRPFGPHFAPNPAHRVLFEYFLGVNFFFGYSPATRFWNASPDPLFSPDFRGTLFFPLTGCFLLPAPGLGGLAESFHRPPVCQVFGARTQHFSYFRAAVLGFPFSNSGSSWFLFVSDRNACSFVSLGRRDICICPLRIFVLYFDEKILQNVYRTMGLSLPPTDLLPSFYSRDLKPACVRGRPAPRSPRSPGQSSFLKGVAFCNEVTCCSCQLLFP